MNFQEKARYNKHWIEIFFFFFTNDSNYNESKVKIEINNAVLLNDQWT